MTDFDKNKLDIYEAVDRGEITFEEGSQLFDMLYAENTETEEDSSFDEIKLQIFEAVNSGQITSAEGSELLDILYEKTDIVPVLEKLKTAVVAFCAADFMRKTIDCAVEFLKEKYGAPTSTGSKENKATVREYNKKAKEVEKLIKKAKGIEKDNAELNGLIAQYNKGLQDVVQKITGTAIQEVKTHQEELSDAKSDNAGMRGSITASQYAKLPEPTKKSLALNSEQKDQLETKKVIALGQSQVKLLTTSGVNVKVFNTANAGPKKSPIKMPLRLTAPKIIEDLDWGNIEFLKNK